MDIELKNQILNVWFGRTINSITDKLTPLVYERHKDRYEYGQIPRKDFNNLFALTWVQWAMRN